MLKNQQETRQTLAVITEMYPDAHCELVHRNPFELLIAVMLSAQTTDVAVNKVTPALFSQFGTPELMAAATPAQIEPFIQTIGLYRNKAKFAVECSRQLLERHNGQVPRTRDELTALAGVGRKTANVVMSVAFGLPALAVDTHVERVSKRLDLVTEKATPLQVEQQLLQKLPEETLGHAHHALIFFGRYFCTAKKPQCEQCPLLNTCRFGQQHIDELHSV